MNQVENRQYSEYNGAGSTQGVMRMNWAERTTRALPSALSAREQLEFLKEFTRAHETHKDDPCAREAECLRQQFAAQLLPPREGDLLVGRRTEFAIGFAPERLVSGVGYYCDEARMQALRKNASFEAAQREQIDELLAYWRGQTTVEKIKARYTPAMREMLTHGPLDKEPGTAFPLYRMAGSQADPDALLRLGIGGMIELVEQKMYGNPQLFGALRSMLLDMADICRRYAEQTRQMAEAASGDRALQLQKMAHNLEWISARPPKTMWQAMQLAYLYYVLAGSFNYGRPDEYLGGYLEADLASGELTEGGAYALVRSLWEMVIERGPAWDGRIALGGRGRKNERAANQFAMLGLKASHELRDILPQLTFRFYDGMDPRLYEKAIEMLGDGVTYPILYNDDVNIPAVMRAFQVDERTAERYLPFGCSEYILYGQSFGTPSGAINLLHCLNGLIASGQLSRCADFEEFYQSFISEVGRYIRLLAEQEKLEYDVCAEEAPFLYFTLLYDDCIERALPMFAGGVRHLGGTLETYGNTNSADSLTAIRRCVYQEKRLGADVIKQALETDFAGREDVRKLLLDTPKFGNDDPEADEIAVRLHDDVCGMIRRSAGPSGLDSYLNVTINNSMNTTFGLTTGASADGRRAHTFMANANNPTGGMDRNGITAMLNSLVKLKCDEHAGSVQNMRFSREMFGALLPKTKGLLRAYFMGGGSQAMVTVLGRGDLENALNRPEDYQNLLVRVGGFSARFIDLDRDVQLELISRTLY